jgi:hypothetical protein
MPGGGGAAHPERVPASGLTAEDPAPDATVVVGLVADPGLPYQLARDIAADLAAELQREVCYDWDWRIAAVEHRFTVDEEGALAVQDVVDAVARRHGLDVVVCITDQPRRTGIQPIVADVDRRAGVAVASLPALGALRLQQRVRHAVVLLVAELVADAAQKLPLRARPAPAANRPARRERFARTTPGEGDGRVRFVDAGLHGRTRLLAGMVRANRPWLLVPQLSSAFAAAFTAGAVVLVTETLWRMAVGIEPRRLGIAAVLAVGTMVAWLVIDHEMWEHPSGARDRELARLYNATTLITLAIGVLCLYAGLFVAGLLVEALLLPRNILGPALGRPAALGDYLAVAWLLATIATVGGAVGTGFASDEAVRQAAYGYRQRERRNQD